MFSKLIKIINIEARCEFWRVEIMAILRVVDTPDGRELECEWVHRYGDFLKERDNKCVIIA